MFVSANSLKFTLDGLKQLKKKDTAQVSSNMGGSYTLTVSKVTEDGLTLTGNVNAPSWFKKVEYSWQDALSSLFVLMPSAEFGVNAQHIALARKAGYQSDAEIVKAVCASAQTYAFLVERALAE